MLKPMRPIYAMTESNAGKMLGARSALVNHPGGWGADHGIFGENSKELRQSRVCTGVLAASERLWVNRISCLRSYRSWQSQRWGAAADAGAVVSTGCC